MFLELNIVFKMMNSKNISHRELKSENLFIKYNSTNNKDFLDRLGDFGLSRKYNQAKFSNNKKIPFYNVSEIEIAHINNTN